MKIGLSLTASQDGGYHDLIEQAVLADQLKFCSVWLNEKHFDQGHQLWSSPLITASYIAAKTRNIRLGFAACISTLYNPVSLAENFANLDVLSQGRVIIGLTRTSINEDCHEVFGTPRKKAWKKFDEQFTIMEQLWRNAFNGYKGKFYKIPKITLYPQLIQQPLPAIQFVVSGKESIIAAAERGVGIFLHAFLTTEEIIANKKLYEAHFIDKLGLGPRITLSRFAYAASGSERACNEIEKPFLDFMDKQFPGIKHYLATHHGLHGDYFDFFKKELMILGDANSCVKQLHALSSDTGIDEFALFLNYSTLPHKNCLESMKIIGAAVRVLHQSAVETENDELSVMA